VFRKKKLDALGDRPPAMFVGDELAESLPARTQATAAMLPDDLRVVIEGSSTGRLLFIAAGLLAVLVLGVRWTEGMYHPGEEVLFVGVPCAVLAWLAHRNLLRRRREFRLVDGGITVAVWPLTGGAPRVTHVPWAEIADYIVSVDYEKAYLRLVSARGYTLTLEDCPPRLSTRELIRRFVEQADRHPRAVEPEPRRKGAPLPDVTGERPPILAGCLTLFALAIVHPAMEVILDPSAAQQHAGLVTVGALALGWHLWVTLDDPESARKDAESKKLMARLRRWLRRVLRIRVD
jgi:hypothetical protein